jgi:hypothetical protein
MQSLNFILPQLAANYVLDLTDCLVKLALLITVNWRF